MTGENNLQDVIRYRRDRLDFPLSFGRSGKSFRQWRDKTRKVVKAALEIDGLPVPTARVLTETRANGCSSQRIQFGLVDGETTEAFLLLPIGHGPFPAILLFHDHGSEFRIGKEKLVEPWDDSEAAKLHYGWISRFYGGRQLGDELVRRGYAVLCADALGWGSRKGDGYEAQQALAANLLQVGTSLAALVAREDIQAAKFLACHPQVDARRIAVAGFSFGGFRAWQTAALCEDIAATIAANWMTTLSSVLRPGNNMLRGQSAFYMLHPPFAARLDFPDVASLIAPRPALFQSGSLDRHFPGDGVEEAFALMRTAWTAAGEPERLGLQKHEAPHVFGAIQQDAAFDWLDTILRPSAACHRA